jgi:hypothetical protein
MCLTTSTIFRVLLLSYHGQKPQSPEVQAPLADWVRRGGVLLVVDDDKDPFNSVREWWNQNGFKYSTPREHLFNQLGLDPKQLASEGKLTKIGKGVVSWLCQDPAWFATQPDGDKSLLKAVVSAASRRGLKLQEANHLLLGRGCYIVAAGLDDSLPSEPKTLQGRFINLFDAELRVQKGVNLSPGSHFLLLDLNEVKTKEPKVLASACKVVPMRGDEHRQTFAVEGVGNTAAILLLRVPSKPRSVTLDSQPLEQCEYSADGGLFWVRFPNEPRPRELGLQF